MASVLLIGALSPHFLLSLPGPAPQGQSAIRIRQGFCGFHWLRQQPGLSGAGGGGCILRGNPPDPRVGDQCFRVFSIQTFSHHVVLLPFLMSLGCPCTFSISPPPQPLSLPRPRLLPSGWPPADSRYRFSWVSKTQPWGELGSGDTRMACWHSKGPEGAVRRAVPIPRSSPALHPVSVRHRRLFPACAPGSPG